MPVDLPLVESLTVEFKSDRYGYPDNELVEALICLANTAGGELWLGIEDDGTPSGLHRNHRNTRHLANLIAQQTIPSLVVSIKKQVIDNIIVAIIIVPQAPQLITTREGICLQRRLKTDGTPECIHILPDS